MKNKLPFQQLLSFAGLLIFISCAEKEKKSHDTWSVFGGSKEGTHYSSLTQLDTNNVTKLQVAWEYHTGDMDTANHSQIQCNPIIVDGILYGTSPQLKLFALDAATGKDKWVFNPIDSIDVDKRMFFVLNNCRGVTYYDGGQNNKHIFYTAGSYLYNINAETGKPDSSFGAKGYIDLHDGLGRDVSELFVTATTPGIIYKDEIIIGTRVDEGAAAAPGHIRAYDVKTGKQKWIFHTIPQPGEAGYETWEDPVAWKHVGGANSWSGFTMDEERGILFAPTGSASSDFYGAKRKGQNLFANSLLAIDAATGKRIWHFQFIHHDVWDRDLPTAPALVTITKDGKKIDAVAQTTKTGMVYIFDRTNGAPVYPIDEVPVDTVTETPGEKIFPTQPIPRLPKPFVRQTFTADDLNPYLPDTSLARVKKELAGYRYGKMFTPPGTQTSIVFPGYDGGAEWGGPAYDPETGILYVNANEMGWKLTLAKTKTEVPKNETYLKAGQRLYTQNCMTCHGPDRKGSGNYPTLIDVNKKYARDSFLILVNSGRRMMPSFKRLEDVEKDAIASYILELKPEQKKPFVAPDKPIDTFFNVAYSTTGYYKFLSPEGYPAIKPPWGTLTAIDLNTGEHVWQTTLGEYKELKEKGVPPTGTENYGGAVVTAGGLVIIAATRDEKIRAFNKRSGKLLWEADLPASGFATPSVYTAGGREYIVIACGGSKLGAKAGDAYVAFALPASEK